MRKIRNPNNADKNRRNRRNRKRTTKHTKGRWETEMTDGLNRTVDVLLLHQRAWWVDDGVRRIPSFSLSAGLACSALPAAGRPGFRESSPASERTSCRPSVRPRARRAHTKRLSRAKGEEILRSTLQGGSAEDRRLGFRGIHALR